VETPSVRDGSIRKLAVSPLTFFCKEPTSLDTCLAWSVCFKRIACQGRRADKHYQRAGAEPDFRIKEQKSFKRSKNMVDDGNKKDCGCGCGEGQAPDKKGKCVMPGVTFPAFVMSLNTSALYHLGEIADPTTGKRMVDLDIAKHAIDTLVLIQNKTKGNLEKDEEELLKNILYDIKLRFVKAVNK
jgi:hypothetical protein